MLLPKSLRNSARGFVSRTKSCSLLPAEHHLNLGEPPVLRGQVRTAALSRPRVRRRKEAHARLYVCSPRLEDCVPTCATGEFPKTKAGLRASPRLVSAVRFQRAIP